MIRDVHGEVFDLAPKEKNFSVQHEHRVGWNFRNKEKNKGIFIDPEELRLEFNEYSTFDNFFETLQLVFQTFTELYPVKIVKRIGLRYINQISFDSGDPFDWKKYISPSLFTIPKKFFDQKCIPLRYLNSLEFKDDDYNVRFVYGLHNSEYPNPINRKEFVLDYDCFINDDIEITLILDKVKEFHKIEDKWFEMSILDALREKMGVE